MEGSAARPELRPALLEFFAGSGLATEGLRPHFDVAWANDICEKKGAIYRANQGDDCFHLGPIEEVSGRALPAASISWASFPCQDLSLAGRLGGIDAARSGLVWHWLRVLDEMTSRPEILVAENVVGLISADGGAQYRSLHDALTSRGYRVGALVLDAVRWAPQSRPRVFVIAAAAAVPLDGLESAGAGWAHTDLLRAVASTARDWIWWRLPEPEPTHRLLADLLEMDAPRDPLDRSQRNVRLIPPRHRERAEQLARDHAKVFPAYRRTRAQGQVLELRFDGISGCLRTPRGGSSRQTLVFLEGGAIETRLLTGREAARLMGAPDSYLLPGSYNDVYRAMGDAVVVPVVEHLARHLLRPLAQRVA